MLLRLGMVTSLFGARFRRRRVRRRVLAHRARFECPKRVPLPNLFELNAASHPDFPAGIAQWDWSAAARTYELLGFAASSSGPIRYGQKSKADPAIQGHSR